MSKSSTTRRKRPLVRCEKVAPARFTISDLDADNNRSKTQHIFYPRYDYRGSIGKTSFVFQTGTIKMSQGGIPALNDTYYPDDSKRDFVKVPLDPEQEACVQLRNMLEELDKRVLGMKEDLIKQVLSTTMSESKLKKKMKKTEEWQKLLDLFEYQPLIRHPKSKSDDPMGGNDSDSEEEDNSKSKKKERVYHPHAKLKLGVDWETKDLTTKLFVREDGKDRPTRTAAKTVTDLSQYLNFNCEAKYIVMANKLYVLKNGNEKNIRKFGVTLKIIQLESKPSAGGSFKDEFDDYAFEGSDDEESSSSESENNKETVDATKATQELEEESGNESEQDEKPAKSKKQAVSEDQSADEKDESGSDSGSGTDEDESSSEEESSDEENNKKKTRHRAPRK